MALVYQKNKLDKDDAIAHGNYSIASFRKDEKARGIIDLILKKAGAGGIDSIQDLHDRNTGKRSTRQRRAIVNLSHFDHSLEFGKESSAVSGSSLTNKWKNFKKIVGIKKYQIVDYEDLLIFGRYLVFAAYKTAAQYVHRAAIHELTRGTLIDSALIKWKVDNLVMKIKNFSRKYDPQQASLIEIRHLRLLSSRLRNIAILLISLGLRVQTASSLTKESAFFHPFSDIVTITTADDKILGDKSRKMNFRCGCVPTGHNVVESLFCLVHNPGLIDSLPISFEDISTILSTCRGGLHSFRRTAAVILRLAALQIPGTWDSIHRRTVAIFIGWSPSSNSPTSYSSDFKNFKLSNLIPATSLIRSALNIPSNITIIDEDNTTVA